MNGPVRPAHRSPLLKRVVLRMLPPAFRSGHGEEIWRSLNDEWIDARERALSGRVRALSSAFMDFGLTALLEWGVAVGSSVPRPANLAQDLRWALRNVRHRPGLAIATILIMAVGIGSVGTVFGVVNGVLLHPMGDGSVGRVVHLMATLDGEQSEAFSHNNLDDLFNRASLLEHASMRDLWSPTLALDRPVRLQGAIVSDEYFAVSGASPSRGRFFSPDDTDVLVVSHGFWRSALASDPNVIGRTLPLDGNSFSVVGVAGPDFLDPWGDIDLWVIMPDAYHVDDRSSAFLLGIARLTDEVDPEAAAAEIRTIGQDLATEFPDVNLGFGIEMVTLKSRAVGDAQPLILSFMGASLLLLMLACANVSTLLLGRAVERRGEMAIRVALGAGRSRQLQQLLTESLLLASFAGVVGTLFAWAGTRGLALMGGASLPRVDDIGLDPMVLIFLVAVTFVTGIVFGVLPALHSAGGDVSLTLRAGRGAEVDHQGRWIQDMLAGTQIALVVVLLVSAGLLLRSAHELSAVDPGFEPDDAFAFSLSLGGFRYPEAGQVDAFRRELLASLAVIPGVESAGMINILPLLGRVQGFPFELGHRPSNDAQTLSAQLRIVSHGYARAAGIDLVDGRWFTQADRVDEALVVVASRAFAQRYLSDVDPVGARITVFGESHQVVGVVDDVREDQLVRSPRPSLYLVDAQATHAPPWLVRNLSTVVRSGLPGEVLAEVVRERLATIDETIPVDDFRSMGDIVESHLAAPHFRATLAGSMAGVALFLALFGLAAAMAYSAEQQAREVGIRLAVGGSPQRVLLRMVGDSARVILVGVAAGVAGAVVTTRALAGFLYSVQPLDTLTFVMVVGGVAITAVIANLVPAARVVGRAPLSALECQR